MQEERVFVLAIVKQSEKTVYNYLKFKPLLLWQLC